MDKKEIITESLVYIEKNLKQKISIEEIADYVGYSKFYFSRMFKQEMNISIMEYVKERKQFGRSIGQFQNTQFQLADMATKVEAAKLLVYKAAMAKATQKTYSFEAAQAKLCAAEVAMEVTTKAVQLHGGYGYIREYDVERMMRDAKITEIYEGTSEVQRMVISANLLK